MKKRCHYYWRLFATALSFTVFGVGGFLLWILVFPLLSLIPSPLSQKKRRAQHCIHYSFYFFIGLMHKMGVMSYDIKGLEKLNRSGQLIIANHPTLIDIVFIISQVPFASCIVKEKLWHNPFTKGPIINAGYISNGDSEKMINQCVACLQSGGTLIIFPEGTRTEINSRYKFQRGAARIALQAKAIVTPITLRCQPSTLTKAEKWYQIPKQPFHLSMQVGEDRILDDFLAIKSKTIAVRRFNRCLEDYYN